MELNTTKPGALRIESVGHVFFAATLIGVGILILIKGDFTARWGGVPKGFPARVVLVYLCAFISLGCGLGVLWRRTAVIASRVLLIYLLLWLLLFRVPNIFSEPASIGTWWPLGDTSVMLAAAWVLYAWFAGERNFTTGDKGLHIARIFYGLGLIPFGVAHFLYVKETVVLIPRWIPWHVFWAYFTGATFIVAGVAIVTGVFARLAATLSALQMGLFSVVVWVPYILTHTLTPFQWGEVVSTIALTAAGWVVADSYRKMPWLGFNQR